MNGLESIERIGARRLQLLKIEPTKAFSDSNPLVREARMRAAHAQGETPDPASTFAGDNPLLKDTARRIELANKDKTPKGNALIDDAHRRAEAAAR